MLCPADHTDPPTACDRLGVAVEAIDQFVSRSQKTQARTELQEALEQVWQAPTVCPRRAELQAHYLYLRCLQSWETSLAISLG